MFISNFPEAAGASAPASARSAETPPAGRAAPSREDASAPAAAPREEQVRNANRHLARLDSRLQFRVDDASGRMVVAVVDRETSEVLRQMPSEEMLSIARRLEAQLGEITSRSGLLLDDEV